MAEKIGRVSGVGAKPVPMKLFATWEVEKSTPNCIPRLCSLTLTRLVILKPLETEMQSVILAVKMQNSKRVLRSNEIIFSPGGLLETDLDLSFSLQYPHLLKREGNKLQVMLQRRKKYKNRTMLGYKTLAMGQVSMAQVLQRAVDRELDLYCDVKERGDAVARVAMLSLISQPVDHDERPAKKRGIADGSCDGELTDEEEPDYSSNEDLSDSDPTAAHDDTRVKRLIKAPFRPTMARQQRNIKQKFIALLRRFKVTDDVLDSEQDQDEAGDQNPQDIEDLFDELENLSESDPEIDTISVLSTPKPKLRPFFSNRGSTDLLDQPVQPKDVQIAAKAVVIPDIGKNSDESSTKKHESDTNLDCSDGEPAAIELAHLINHLATCAQDSPPKTPPSKPHTPKAGLKLKREMRHRLNKLTIKQNSYERNDEPRKVVLEQLNRVLPADESLPDSLVLISTSEWQGQLLSQSLEASEHRVVCTCSAADVKATILCIVTKIQKFCNSNSRAPAPIKIAIAGSDSYINSVLFPYVELFSAKSPDWQNYIKFLIIPLGCSSIGKYLAQNDSKYSNLFNDVVWRDVFEKSESSNSSHIDTHEISNRISNYLTFADTSFHIPISEAMLTYHKDHRSVDEESSQVFVPFLSEAKVGPSDLSSAISSSMDIEEPSPMNVYLSGSPPQQSALTSQQSALTSQPVTPNLDKVRCDNQTPPSSPAVTTTPASTPGHSTVTSPASTSAPLPECLELQVDYWTTAKPDVTERTDRLMKKDSKYSLKSPFRSLFVHRFPPVGQACDTTGLFMAMVTKEKKQKIMKFGKKSKECESRSHVIDGMQRVICTSRSQNQPITVTIDGTDWMGVKFFQISSQWQTHIKAFTVLLFENERYTADAAM